MIDHVERLLNHASDMDTEWGPFLFLRPEREERMTSARVAQLAALYGVLAGVVVNVVARVTDARGADLNPLFFPALTTLAFFTLYRFTFAASWNRRAARLAKGMRS